MKHKLLICIFSLFLFLTITNLSFGLSYYELIEKEGYKIIYKIPLGNNSVQILGIPDKEKSNKFLDSKEIILVDEDNSLLDRLAIRYPDTAYRGSFIIGDSAIAFRMTFHEPYRDAFIYADSISSFFKFFDCDKFVADGIIFNNFIIFSTEFNIDTIKKINTTTGETFVYDGYYPNADLFYIDSEENPEFGTIWFQYNKKTYIIEDDRIVLSNTVFPVQKKLRVYDFILKK